MTTPGGVRSRVTARLRAIAGRSRRTPRMMCACKHAEDAHVDPGGCCVSTCECLFFSEPKTRISTVSFERSHRDTVWIPPDPPLRWFREQDSEPMPQPKKRGSR